MRRSLASRKYYIAGLIAVFAVTCLIASSVVFLCRNTDPGKIIPKELTSRGGKFDEDIVGRTAIEASDCIAFKNGTLDSGVLLDDYIDPFFFIGSLLPEGALEAFFYAVYIFKFGLAASVMYSFLRRRLALKRTFAILMGISYALSSRVIFVSSLSQAQNAVILIPAALSFIYAAARKNDIRSHVLVAVSTFLLCLSGMSGTLSGTLFVAAASLIVCFAVIPSGRKALARWGKILAFGFCGICCSLCMIIPRVISYGITYDFKQVIEDRRVYYSFFDMISTAFSGAGGSLDYSAVPTLYFGILPLMLLILFFFNRKIPARLKFCALLLIALTHISCAVSVADLTLTFFGQSSIVTDLRLIGLYAVVFFLASLCLVNLEGLSDIAVLAAGICPILALILFNGLGGAVSYNFTSLYLPGAVCIVLGALIYRYRKDFLPRKFLYPFLAAGIALIFVNTFIIYASGSVEPGDVSASFRGEEEYAVNELISDEDLSVFNSEEDMYLVIPVTGANLLEPSILPVYMDSVSAASTGQKLFAKKEFEIISTDGINREEDGYFTAESDSAELVIGMDNPDGKELYVYCGFDGSNYFEEDDGSAVSSIYIDGAFLKQITRRGDRIEVVVGIDDRQSVTAPIEVLALDREVMDKLAAKSGVMGGKRFTIPKSAIGMGEQYMLTNIPYDDRYEVYIDNSKTVTYSVQDNLAVRFEGHKDGSDVEVRITRGAQGGILGISLSLIAVAVTASIAVIGTLYENKKKGRVSLAAKEESGNNTSC
ncbi:MAG: YfhO family protein [Clostridiales bacterium]|nr:YfhO family protein [Clostridiales bacterium]